MTVQTIAALEHIVLEERQPGDDVPSVTELVDRLGVSRLTIREAIRALEARGLISTSKGRRPRVAPPNGALIGDFFRTAVLRNANAILQLTEIRVALEVQSAELAARHASQAAIVTMQESVDALTAGLEAEDEDAFHRADIRFHELLADASGNFLLSTLLGEMAGALRISRSYSFRGHRDRTGSFGDVVDAHQRILDRVVEHDPAGAGRLMRRHLADTQRDLEAALRDRAAPPPNE